MNRLVLRVRGAASGVLLFAAGLPMALPGGGKLGLDHLQLTLTGIGYAGTAVAVAWGGRRFASRLRAPPA